MNAPRTEWILLPTSHDDPLYEQILSLIVAGRLPSGQQLDSRDICQSFDVTEPMVAKALHRLSDEHLVTIAPDGRATVAQPSAEEFLQLLFAYAELAARWSVPDMRDDEVAALCDVLEDLREAAERGDPVGLNFAVDDFIGQLLTATPNALFEEAAVQLLTRCRFLFLTAAGFHYWDVRDQLEAFRAALLARDGAALAGGLRLLGRATQAHVRTMRAAHARRAGDDG